MKIPPNLVKQMAHYGDAWPRIPEQAQEVIIAQEQKNYDRLHQVAAARAERKRPPRADFVSIEADARWNGWLNLAEIGSKLGCRWDSVLGWCEKAGESPVELLHPGRDTMGLQRWQYVGLYPASIVLVKKAFDDHFAKSRADDEAANVRADAEVLRLAEEKAAYQEKQLQDRAAYLEQSRLRRQQHEADRQARLALTREKDSRKRELAGARRDVRRLRMQTRLAEEQFKSTKSADARRLFWATRRGKQNFEYASTNFKIGRGWARGVMERYHENLEAAGNLLADLEAAYQADYPG